MTRKRMTGFSWCRWVLPLLALGVGLLAGCGEQDLYSPPHSPYEIVGRVPLPSVPEDVSILGNHAFVAGGEGGLHSIDITDPSNPVLLTTADTPKYAWSVRTASTPDAGGVMDIAFVVEGTEGIRTYDITNSDSLVVIKEMSTGSDGNGLFVELTDSPSEPYLVYLADSYAGLKIFRSVPGVAGELTLAVSHLTARGYTKSVSVANGWAYVADDEMGLAVFDVRFPAFGAPVGLVSATDTPGRALGVDIQVDPVTGSGFAFVADGLNGLVVMAIRQGDAPTIVGGLALPGTSRAIVVRDDRAFIAAQDGGIHFVDITDPTAPILEGTVVTAYATGVAVSSSGIVAATDRVDGLLILGGLGPYRDTTPPATVEDLTAVMRSSSRVGLSWHAPGNDLYQGTASGYDLRYATTPITEQNWETAAAVANPPNPMAAGTLQTYTVENLEPGTEYFFALRTVDPSQNWSKMSNVGSATTATGNVPPILSGPSVTPPNGRPDETTFVYQVTYEDGDGDVPTEAVVRIDGVANALSLASGDPDRGAIYRFSTTLPLGIHNYSFSFDDGNGHAVATGETAGPLFGRAFVMGSPDAEPGRDPDEVVHPVVLPGEIWVSDHEVTQAEYQDVVGSNPSRFVSPEYPVENVSWFDAVEYCNLRSVREGFAPAYAIQGEEVLWNRDADGYRLPTEAEWEEACRAGAADAFPLGGITETGCIDALGNADPILDQLGWYCGNAGVTTHDVKQKQPNAAGLYDMCGNVWEWCWDWYGDLGTDLAFDPVGPATGILRVRRGGSWYQEAKYCRSASRDMYYPNSKDDLLGFRVVRTLP